MATSSAPKKAKSSVRALSLHLGLNAVDPRHYGGWDGPLAACEFDALDMADIARAQSMTPTVMLTTSATRAKVLAAIRKAAKALVKGDLFFMSYSGHGGQIPDVSGEEPDKKDETWCLFDGQLIDDELYLELTRFAAGVRVLVLSDSCHSGTVTRAAPAWAGGVPMGVPGARPRLMPATVAMRTYQQHQAFYDRLQMDVAKAAGDRPVDPDAALSSLAVSSDRLTAIAAKARAAVILISGCQDNQTSMDGDHNGAFTEQLLRVWDHAKFIGSYARLHQLARAGLPPTQSPNLFTLGPARAFVAARPFTV